MSPELTPAEVRSYYTARVPSIRQTEAAEWRGPCPVHGGKRDSFAVNSLDGRWYCHSNCGRGGDLVDLEEALSGTDVGGAIAEVERIVGRPPGNNVTRSGQPPTIEATYDYVDEAGKLVYQVVRFRPKSFRQRRRGADGKWIWNIQGVRRVLYRLPDVLAAEAVIITEGEKDADTVRGLGINAAVTTASGGAGKWEPSYAEVLRGKRVFVIPDNDEPGRRHAVTVAQSLIGIATVAVLELPAPAKDFTDWNAVQPDKKTAVAGLVELSKTAPAITNESDIESLAQRWGLTDKTAKTDKNHAEVRISSVLSVNSDAGATGEWPVPEALEVTVAPVIAFYPELLPAGLRSWVMDVIHRMQAVPDFALVGCLSALSIAIGRRARVYPKQKDSWYRPLNLWGAVIGEPGTKKTSVISTMLAPIRRIEAEWDKDFQKSTHEFELREAEFEIEHARWKQDARDAAKGGVPVPSAIQKPSPPRRRRLTTADATCESAQLLMADNPAGIGIVRDELTGFLKAMEKAGRESDRAFWLECWNGTEPFRCDRVGRGPTTVPAACASIIGGIQPDVLEAYFRFTSSGEVGDGLLQRFQLAVWPDPSSPDSWQYVDRQANHEAAEQAERVFRRIVGELHEENPLELRFTPEAQEVFIEWLRVLETVKLRDENLSAAHASHLAKYPSLMPTLAAILHITDAAAGSGSIPERIDVHHARQAVALCEYLESHATRLYKARPSASSRGARKLASKIRVREIGAAGYLTVREIQRKGWSGLVTRDEVQLALVSLEESGWVRQATSTAVTRGRPSERYEVNPGVWK